MASHPSEGRAPERDKALPYYRWYVQDHRGSRNVQRLSWIERGMYRELLDECWDRGGIPDDLAALADIVDCPADDMARAWPALKPLFHENGDGSLQSPRLEKERSAEDRHRVDKARAGRKGGLAKASNARGGASSATDVLASSSSSSSIAEQEQFSALGAASPSGGLSPSRCPFCEIDNGHAPDCRPSRVTAPARVAVPA